MAWTNADGLTVYYGAEEAALANGGEYRNDGLFRIEDEEINLTSLTTTYTRYTREIFPWGKTLGRVELIADVAATGGGTLDIGFGNVRANTEIDYDGAVAALPTAQMNAEGKLLVLTQGQTYAGALLGQTVTNNKVPIGLFARYNTTAFTAGRIRVRLYWYKKTSTT